MKSLFRGLATISLFLISVASTSAQKVEFSADMRVSDGAGRTQTLRLYDPEVNFIVKVLRTSKSGAQSGYELQNVKQETQPPALFEVPNGYHKFTLTRLADVLAGLGQW
jgi:hypothetical protein